MSQLIKRAILSSITPTVQEDAVWIQYIPEKQQFRLFKPNGTVWVELRLLGFAGEKGEPGETGPVGPMCEIQVGTVTRLPIGSEPTVTIEEDSSGDFYLINFGIPEYDISAASYTALENSLKTYIDNKFAAINTALETWKNGVQDSLDTMQDAIDDFKDTVESWMEENERVLANALVRHEEQLEG